MSELMEVSLAKLEAHPNNIRKEVAFDADFDDLVAGIKSVGLIHPPLVVPHPTAKTKYRIVTGHRRFAAAQKAGLKEITVELREDLSEKQQRDMQYQENKHRVGNSVMERAKYVANELDMGGRTIAELAKGMGVSQDQVRTSKKLAHAPGKVHAKINDGQMNLEDALVLAEFNGDADAQKALLDAWGSWNWSIEVRRWRNLREAQKQAPKTRRELTGAGAVIVDDLQNVGHHQYAPAGLSTEEHVAAGHVAIIDETNSGKALWYVPVEAEAEPEKTSEELEAEAAAAKAAADLAAELALAGQVRAEALKAAIKTPRPGVAAELMSSTLAKRVVNWKHWDLVGVPADSSVEDVAAALQKLGVESMVMLEDILQHSAEGDLVRGLEGWGPSSWGSDYGKAWRDRLRDVYGYQWSDLELGFMRQRIESVSGSCKECDAQLFSDEREHRLCAGCAEDLCDQCGSELDDGEGSDGKCGDCADRAAELANADDVEVAQ